MPRFLGNGFTVAVQGTFAKNTRLSRSSRFLVPVFIFSSSSVVSLHRLKSLTSTDISQPSSTSTVQLQIRIPTNWNKFHAVSARHLSTASVHGHCGICRVVYLIGCNCYCQAEQRKQKRGGVKTDNGKTRATHLDRLKSDTDLSSLPLCTNGFFFFCFHRRSYLLSRLITARLRSAFVHHSRINWVALQKFFFSFQTELVWNEVVSSPRMFWSRSRCRCSICQLEAPLPPLSFFRLNGALHFAARRWALLFCNCSFFQRRAIVESTDPIPFCLLVFKSPCALFNTFGINLFFVFFPHPSLFRYSILNLIP